VTRVTKFAICPRGRFYAEFCRLIALNGALFLDYYRVESEGKMRWASLLAVCLASSLFAGSPAPAANDNAFQIGDWSGRAHWNQKQKQLDRCSAQLTNPDKITVIYSVDRHYMWTLELSNPSWNFPKGAAFDVSFGTGSRDYFRQRVTALDAKLVRVQLPDTVNAFEAFRRIIRLELVAGGLTSNFDMAFANQVLTALTRCVTRYGATAKSRAAITSWLRSSIGHASGPSDDPEVQKEATALATSIMSEAQIANAASVKPDDVPAGTDGDTVWKIGETLFTISILPRDETPEIADLSDLIIGGDAQKCRGDFFSGATLDVIETTGVARAYTNCQTQQASSSAYYFILPRKQGGLYLMTTATSGIEVTPTAEKNSKEIDGRVRATIMTALSKM
jgi:hypothetical protein